MKPEPRIAQIECLASAWFRSHGKPVQAGCLVLSLVLVSPAIGAIETGEDNLVSGDCQALYERIGEYGVWDAAGYHPGQPGNTHVQVQTRDIGYRLNYRNDETGRVCAFTRVRIRLSVENLSSRIDWQPDGGMAPDCSSQRRDWHEAITRHEEAHVAANLGLEAAYNRDAPMQRYEMCEDTAEDARLALSERVSQAAGDAVRDMLKRIQAEVDRYHQRHGSHIPLPQCCRGRVGDG